MSVALVLVGLLLMKSHGWSVVLVAFGIVVFVPAGLSILAEPAVDWLHSDEAGRRVAAFFITGPLLLGGSALIAVKRLETTQTAYVLIAFAALALLVFAIVSSTQADIAAVIAAVSLMGITSAADRWPAELTPKAGDQRVLVALGDSYMSGEGAQTYYEANADSGGKGSRNHCHRSPTAWAAIAGRNDFDSMAFLACSGAKTSHVRYRAETNLPGPARQYNEPGSQLAQVSAFEQGLSPSLVVISPGAGVRREWESGQVRSGGAVPRRPGLHQQLRREPELNHQSCGARREVLLP
ncbi:hypothetical protein [Kribbella sp. NPDC051718]|uniref:hypothetical protein n=1 Tax=Kribbella sp. NPDC051718 TaxID=3155168 RepID=UPI003444AB87